MSKPPSNYQNINSQKRSQQFLSSSKISRPISNQFNNNNTKTSSVSSLHFDSSCLISTSSAAQMQDEKCFIHDYLGNPYYPYSTNYQYEFTRPSKRYAMNLELYEMLLSDPAVFHFSGNGFDGGGSLELMAPILEG